MTVVVTVAALLVLVVLLPFLAEAFRVPITKSIQDKAPGQIARLPQGATHYRWSGPEDGPVAICIHGLSTPSYIFAATENSLVGLGYRVLTYDLFGRGYSHRAKGPQTADFFLSQLRALLENQNVKGEVVVLGFSMGGQIATAFASEEGTRIKALIIVASAGLQRLKASGHSRFWLMPWIGGWLTRVAGGWALRRELVESRTTATVIPDLEDRQAAETRTRGFLPALLSSRRHLLANAATEDHAQIARNGTPVLAIWGAEDPVISLSAIGALAEVNPNAQHVQISGAGHSLLQTHPAQVAEALRKFLTP